MFHRVSVDSSVRNGSLKVEGFKTENSDSSREFPEPNPDSDRAELELYLMILEQKSGSFQTFRAFDTVSEPLYTRLQMHIITRELGGPILGYDWIRTTTKSLIDSETLRGSRIKTRRKQARS